MSLTLNRALQSKLDQLLDQDDRSREFSELGKKLYEIFGADGSGENRRVSTQVRNLQQIALTARRFTDVEAFVKNQMGRNTAQAKSWRDVGQQILEQLKRLREIAAREGGNDSDQVQAARLWLVRGWVRSVVSGYLYAKATDEMPQSGRSRR